ncbi:MAG: hypothetical protein OCD02_03195 [Spirochaetaceae bacterium]
MKKSIFSLSLTVISFVLAVMKVQPQITTIIGMLLCIPTIILFIFYIKLDYHEKYLNVNKQLTDTNNIIALISKKIDTLSDSIDSSKKFIEATIENSNDSIVDKLETLKLSSNAVSSSVAVLKSDLEFISKSTAEQFETFFESLSSSNNMSNEMFNKIGKGFITLESLIENIDKENKNISRSFSALSSNEHDKVKVLNELRMDQIKSLMVLDFSNNLQCEFFNKLLNSSLLGDGNIDSDSIKVIRDDSRIVRIEDNITNSIIENIYEEDSLIKSVSTIDGTKRYEFIYKDGDIHISIEFNKDGSEKKRYCGVAN